MLVLPVASLGALIPTAFYVVLVWWGSTSTKMTGFGFAVTEDWIGYFFPMLNGGYF